MIKIEANKLIAGFMNRPTRITDRGYLIFVPTEYDTPQYVNYDTDWNLLMPVYIKIAKEELWDESDEAIIIFNIMYERLGDGDGIEEVFNWVVKFIQWYKQNH